MEIPYGLKFELEIYGDDKTDSHILEIKNVSSYYFINDFGDERKEFILSDEPSDYREFISIEFLKEKTILNIESQAEWPNNKFKSQLPIVIMIWQRFLFIEAEIVVIDSIEYQLESNF